MSGTKVESLKMRSAISVTRVSMAASGGYFEEH
jgi:hypothetical protein